MNTFAVRAASVTSAYLAAAVVVFATIFLMRSMVSASVLREVLGFQFVAAIAAGLEPATAKAAFIHDVSQSPRRASVLVASAVKALAMAPVLAFIWRLADPAVPFGILLLTPITVVAGFWATDVRVMLDLRGRHASAVWLKQGSLAGGLALFAILIASGASMFLAVLVSSVTRLAVPLLVGPAADANPSWTAARLLGDPRWLELAATSAIAAAGGSIDRLAALRWLPATTCAGYYLLYEAFSRFWVIPYLATPILFARTVQGDADRFGVAVRRFTIAAGVLFVLTVAIILVVAAAPISRLIGVPLGASSTAFAGAIVLAALTQLRMARLQASGGARRVLLVSLLGTLVAGLVFVVGARTWGVDGLLWAWLIKSAVELGGCTIGGPVEQAA